MKNSPTCTTGTRLLDTEWKDSRRTKANHNMDLGCVFTAEDREKERIWNCVCRSWGQRHGKNLHECWSKVESSCKELNKQADTETEKEDIDISGQVVVHGDTTITSSRLEGRPRKRSYKRYNQGQYEADSHENTKKLKTSEERDVKEQNVEPTEAATQPRQEP
ncbi:hypothetical protein V6N13_089033 [Hibiscus sabdariffa]